MYFWNFVYLINEIALKENPICMPFEMSALEVKSPR